MARRKKRKSKSKKTTFSFGSSKKSRTNSRPPIKATLIVLAVVFMIVAVVVGFYFLERYVTNTAADSRPQPFLELMDTPVWVNKHLKAKIRDAAMFYEQPIESEKDIAKTIQLNIEKNVVWIKTVRVQKTHESVKITATWRKPLALVKMGLKKCYLDAESVVLDFVPAVPLPTPRITGLPLTAKAPKPSLLWKRDDLAAAIAILDRLDKMDALTVPEKPLLSEIERIDISNFDGRENNSAPHIMFYAKDNTQIIWGADL